jgi:PAS domain S-box-containing protein
MPSQTMGFQALLEAVPDALVGVDEAGIIRFVNHQTESLFGYDRDDLVGAALETLVPESLRQVHAAHREGYHGAPQTRHMGTGLKLSGRRQDGTEFPVDIALSPVYTGDSMVVIAAVRDMTDYRQAQEEHGRLARLAAMVEHSDDAIFGETLEGIITSWNPAAERIFGYSNEEMTGRSVDLLCPKDRIEEIKNILTKIRAGQSVEHFETMRVRKNGTVFPVSLTVSPVRDAGGAVAGASVIARDVTEQRAALLTAQRMAAIVQSSGDAISSSTLEGIITSWNPAAERLSGYSSEDVIGKFGDFLSPMGRTGEMNAILARIMTGEHVADFETSIVRKDGTGVPVSITLSPIHEADGTVIGLSTVTHDLTAQKQASELARSMIEASLDSMVSISPEGNITDVNEATVKLTGVPREKLVGTSFSDYFTEPEKAEEIYQQVFTEGMAVDYPLIMRHRNGPETVVEVLYNASVYRDTQGNVLGVFAAARDVTKQIQAQKEAADQHARELERLAELERFQRLTVGREIKMIELKKEIEYLRKFRPPSD